MPRKRLGAVRRIVKLIMASPATERALCICVSEDCPVLRQGPHRVEAQYLFRKEGCEWGRALLETPRRVVEVGWRARRATRPPSSAPT